MEMALRARKNKKGFTLVEVIVVLVILAILAAILVPSMIGWINKANEKTAVVEGRTMLVAAQTVVSENYSTLGTGAGKTMSDDQKAAVATLANVGATATTVEVNNGQVTKMVVTSSAGYTVTYTMTTAGGKMEGNFTVAKP